MTYEEKLSQLEDIVGRMERGGIGLDELTTQLATAQKLIKELRQRLTDTEQKIAKQLEE